LTRRVYASLPRPSIRQPISWRAWGIWSASRASACASPPCPCPCRFLGPAVRRCAPWPGKS